MADDLISRQAAIEWLKKVGRCWKACEGTKLLRKMLGGIINHVEKMPSVDAVEVVRCKDCVRCGFCGEATNLEVMGFYGYCSRGKRREENG